MELNRDPSVLCAVHPGECPTILLIILSENPSLFVVWSGEEKKGLVVSVGWTTLSSSHLVLTHHYLQQLPSPYCVPSRRKVIRDGPPVKLCTKGTLSLGST